MTKLKLHNTASRCVLYCCKMVFGFKWLSSSHIVRFHNIPFQPAINLSKPSHATVEAAAIRGDYGEKADLWSSSQLINELLWFVHSFIRTHSGMRHVRVVTHLADGTLEDGSQTHRSQQAATASESGFEPRKGLQHPPIVHTTGYPTRPNARECRLGSATLMWQALDH